MERPTSSPVYNGQVGAGFFRLGLMGARFGGPGKQQPASVIPYCAIVEIQGETN